MIQIFGQQIKWDFKTNGDLIIKDKNGNKIYHENSTGFWSKYERDSQGNCTYNEDSNGYWSKWEYNSKGNCIYFEHSNGYWVKKEYNSQGFEIYCETSNGTIKDRRPKPCENKIVEIEGVKYKLVRVSD